MYKQREKNICIHFFEKFEVCNVIAQNEFGLLVLLIGTNNRGYTNFHTTWRVY